MNLYDQLLNLQTMPHAFQEWVLYRKELTQFIIDQCPAKTSIAIFGAGPCNDMDLGELAKHFKSITLLDQDVKGMNSAIRQYGLEQASHIVLRETGFTGIHKEDYRHYADSLVQEVRKRGNQTSIHALSKLALMLLSELEAKMMSHSLDFGTKEYDYTVVVGIHSQLLCTLEWIWSVILQTLGQEEGSVRAQIIELNQKVTPLFNNAVLKSTRQRLILGCEIGRVGKIGSIQGAVQGIQDVKQRLFNRELTLIVQKIERWPFNSEAGKVYDMQLQALLLKDNERR